MRVPPKMMGISRRGEREAGESDQIDARAIARAVLREGIERFPTAFLDEQALEIRLLCVTTERTLPPSAPESSTDCAGTSSICAPSLRPASPAARSTAPARWSASRGGCERSSSPRACVSAPSSCVASASSPAASTSSNARSPPTSVEHRPILLAETGCGPVTAAILIGHTAGAQRFPSDGHFAPGRQSPRSPSHRADDTAIACTAAIASSTRRCNHRRHTRPHRPRNAGLPGAQTSRGQDDRRSAALPQALPRPGLSPPARATARRASAVRCHRHAGPFTDVVLDIGATENASVCEAVAQSPRIRAVSIQPAPTYAPRSSRRHRGRRDHRARRGASLDADATGRRRAVTVSALR